MEPESHRSMIEGRSWKGWLVGILVVAAAAVSIQVARDDARRERRMRQIPIPLTKEFAQVLREGAISNGRYQNPFFRLSFPVPEGWRSLTPQEIEETETKTGTLLNSVYDSNKGGRAERQYSTTICAFLNTADVDGAQSALIFGIEVLPPGDTLDDYLQAVATRGEVAMLHPPTDLEIRGRKFKMIEIQPIPPAVSTTSYLTLHDSYVLIFLTFAAGTEDARKLNEVISGIEFAGAL